MTDGEIAALRSRKLFNSGFCCAESVLLAVAETKGAQSEVIPKIATGFCSGMAETNGLCGALAGGVMGLNLFTGRSSKKQNTEENYAAIKKLISRFVTQFGSSNCRELTGCDLGTQDGQKRFRATKQKKRCNRYVEEVTRTAILLIDEQTREHLQHAPTDRQELYKPPTARFSASRLFKGMIGSISRNKASD